MVAPKVRQSIVVDSQKHPAEQSLITVDKTAMGSFLPSMKEKLLIEGKQMKLEVTKQTEETARHISSGKRWGVWLRETVNLQSNLEDIQQQQHLRPLVTTHEFNRFCRERLLMTQKRRDYERIAC
jgi:hypothetical protein